jgi:hypothetical protein
MAIVKLVLHCVCTEDKKILAGVNTGKGRQVPAPHSSAVQAKAWFDMGCVRAMESCKLPPNRRFET